MSIEELLTIGNVILPVLWEQKEAKLLAVVKELKLNGVRIYRLGTTERFIPPSKLWIQKQSSMRSYILLLFLLFLEPAQAQTIYEQDMYGKKLFFVDENTLLKQDLYGEKLFFWDGCIIRRKDLFGDKLFYIEGNVVRRENRYGEKLYFFDGYTIREKDRYGRKLYFLDGRVLRKEDRYGKPVCFFEGIPDRWILVAIISLTEINSLTINR